MSRRRDLQFFNLLLLFFFATLFIYFVTHKKNCYFCLQIAAAKSSAATTFHHQPPLPLPQQPQQQTVVMSPPPTMQPASPPPPPTIQATQTSQIVRVNGSQSAQAVTDNMANTMPVTKRSPKDYIFGKVIGEGSYSTVRIYYFIYSIHPPSTSY